MAKTAKTKTTKTTPGKSLEDILFDCRNVLRGKVDSSVNRDAVMGLVFLKFAGDKYAARRTELEKEYSDVPPAVWDKPSFYISQNVFYLREHCRWAHLSENAASDDIANMLDTAMADIEHDNETLRGALPQRLYTDLRVESRTVKSLIDTINQISTERFGSDDLIGRVYQYFLQSFAMDERKEKGEFYTPRSIVELIAELIEPYEGRIYDPCCGSGGMFVQSVKFIEAHNGQRIKASVIGQESNPSTYRLAKMNLAVRGITCDLGKYASSSFTDDQHRDLKADFIMANPPFNLKDWRGADELRDDGRWTGYGLPPTGNANYAWILHMLSKLDVSHGIAGFLLANGALSADDEELTIRSRLIENDKIEAIIVLPRNMLHHGHQRYALDNEQRQERRREERADAARQARRGAVHRPADVDGREGGEEVHRSQRGADSGGEEDLHLVAGLGRRL